MLLATSKMNYMFNLQITWSANWFFVPMMRRHHRQMTRAQKVGSWEISILCRKKGLGRGLHQSDVICSTIGWLREASKTLEYGKNYDGYWNGEMFVKQVFY